ncbi:MAG: hypothetical protein M3422_19010, partial [Actinomycetota bacterium]|nr:hypothetical protein [Actinomycetota bacterium]
NDGTQVELDELAALNATFRGLSDSIRTTADTAVDIRYHSNVFGAFSWLFAQGANDAASRTAQGLYALSSNVMVDAENVTASATEFDETEQTQVGRFRSADHG